MDVESQQSDGHQIPREENLSISSSSTDPNRDDALTARWVSAWIDMWKEEDPGWEASFKSGESEATKHPESKDRYGSGDSECSFGFQLSSSTHTDTCSLTSEAPSEESVREYETSQEVKVALIESAYDPDIVSHTESLEVPSEPCSSDLEFATATEDIKVTLLDPSDDQEPAISDQTGDLQQAEPKKEQRIEHLTQLINMCNKTSNPISISRKDSTATLPDLSVIVRGKEFQTRRDILMEKSEFFRHTLASKRRPTFRFKVS